MSKEELKIGDWCRDTLNNETFQIEEINYNVEVHEDPFDFRSSKIKVTQLVSHKNESVYRADKVKLIVKGFGYD